MQSVNVNRILQRSKRLSDEEWVWLGNYWMSKEEIAIKLVNNLQVKHFVKFLSDRQLQNLMQAVSYRLISDSIEDKRKQK